ncbi:MAG: class III cytochrome c, partial [Deltaproteobacteria bacterium]|nr:class III cytochrome c [Deltaproteobacteria bacterium]
MKDRKRSLVAGICVLVALIICLTLTIEAREEDEKQSTDSKKRADLITIDVLESFGALERPDVPFFHDLHTDAL